MKRIAIVLIWILIFTGVVFAAADFKMKKDLAVTDGESYPYSNMSVGGTIKIAPQGKVQGSLIVINGSLKLEGLVAEDVICVGSTVQLGENAFIHGDLYVIGGSIMPPEKITVEKKVKGEYLNLKFNLKKIESTLMPILSDSNTLAFFKVLKIVFWGILALIVFALVPRKIIASQEVFESHLLKISLIGLISSFSFVFLLLVFAILSIVIIGIPFLVVLIIAYLALYIFGRTVLFYFVGVKLAQRFHLKNISPALFIIIGLMCYAILEFVPLVGPLLLIILNVLQIGIGIGYFFRKKLGLHG